MSAPPDPTPKRDLEALLSRVLSASVLLASTVGLFGLVLYLRDHRGVRSDLSTFTPEPEQLREQVQIAAAAMSFDSEAVLQLAVVLLILTPIVRVVFSLVMFAYKRDKLYVGITLVVLAALAVGFFADLT